MAGTYDCTTCGRRQSRGECSLCYADRFVTYVMPSKIKVLADFQKKEDNTRAFINSIRIEKLRMDSRLLQISEAIQDINNDLFSLQTAHPNTKISDTCQDIADILNREIESADGLLHKLRECLIDK